MAKIKPNLATVAIIGCLYLNIMLTNVAAYDSYSPKRLFSPLIYSPLDCNINAIPSIFSEECVGVSSIPISTLVANTANTDPVIVPCGTCAHVDIIDGSTLTFPSGLYIFGRLHFPTSANLILNTTSIVVQGHLDIGIPDEGNKVKINLYGTERQYFYPHDRCCSISSTLVTTCDPDCEYKIDQGKKPIIVVGGTLDIQAIDTRCPSWTTLKDVRQIPNPDDSTNMVNKEFVVGPEFARCIRPGDDLIITSDTFGGWDKHFEWKAESVVDSDTGVVAMQGYDTTDRTFATEAGPGESIYATEVANLRRDVIFEGQKDDPNDLHGAHMIIYHTKIAQTISGVNFQNFGQAGNLGRYPIHFHICGPTPNSIVSKNVIHNSNQRCVVIHESDEVTIHDNVAYKTRGHCYVTEIGTEVNNTFTRNLGAETMGLGANIGQSDSCCDGHVHHNEPSTFWIRNTQNHFIGNVAAGALFNGWWFEMVTKYTPLLTFRDNVAHSSKQGLITYPQTGWIPPNGPDGPAVIENFRAYKNSGDGIKFHNSGNFILDNSVIADNGIGIKNFFSDTFIVQNTRIIGRSEDARLRLGWKNTMTDPGLDQDYNSKYTPQLRNVTFSEFRDGKKAIELDYTRRFGAQNREMGYPLSTVEVTFDSSVTFDSRDPLARDSPYIMYMEDVNGTMGPEDKGPGFFVENTSRMTAFVADQCSPLNDNNDQTLFCEDICLQHLEIFPQNYLSGYYKTLKLTNGNSSFVYDSSPTMQFDVLLPPGEFFGNFYDVNGTEINPPSVRVEAILPAAREGCGYSSSSSILFDIVDRAPKVQLFNFLAAEWLWAGYDTTDVWTLSRGARGVENPVEETVWTLETLDCPTPMSDFYLPRDVVCYQIVGGGYSRRRLYAQTNRKWTQSVGARHGPDGSTARREERWYLEKTYCSPNDVRDCFFVINAYNGRRLYKVKSDFGASPGGVVIEADFCKWYLEDIGTSNLFSFIAYSTALPSMSPVTSKIPSSLMISSSLPSYTVSAVLSVSPSSILTPSPTNDPSPAPSISPMNAPSSSPSISSTKYQSVSPSEHAAEASVSPSSPTDTPSSVSSPSLTDGPSYGPSLLQLIEPSFVPLSLPTSKPSFLNSSVPTKSSSPFNTTQGPSESTHPSSTPSRPDPFAENLTKVEVPENATLDSAAPSRTSPVSLLYLLLRALGVPILSFLYMV